MLDFELTRVVALQNGLGLAVFRRRSRWASREDRCPPASCPRRLAGRIDLMSTRFAGLRKTGELAARLSTPPDISLKSVIFFSPLPVAASLIDFAHYNNGFRKILPCGLGRLIENCSNLLLYGNKTVMKLSFDEERFRS
ncbi:hypothetical protein [Agrobacterium radiobacter]|uniref:hypothetical protein n=1 Tax=Agrobacterium radiobacter TaxID=362 RepID=UPI003F85D4DF